ncbi:MAG: SUMF1/EgtB/PvdO family nonheme iron enzyme, partial [Verrucomicrobiae bacterium]|nr:SUMF1/EgtB/PvdO family nonheme iron enzyme [Verrucomicrobiae bacterium]
ATYRLPTEAEWEFACRAGSTTWFSFGDKPEETIHRFANVGNVELEKFRPHSVERQWLLPWDRSPEDGHVFTAPVGSFEGNALGLRDLHGNVWEWCADLWLDTFYKRFDRPGNFQPRKTAVDPVNESEPQTEANRFRAIRGGSWYNGPILCRSDNRAFWDEPDAACYLGFRVVREADPAISTKALEAYEAEQTALAAIERAGGEIASTNRGLEIEVRLTREARDLSALAPLAKIPGLVRLSLDPRGQVAVTDADLRAIAAATELESVEFRGSFDLANADLGLLAKRGTLRELAFSRSSSLTDADLEKLAPLTGLERFRCHGAAGGLTDAGISHLKGNAGLVSLEIAESEATGAFLADFAACPLEELSLSGNGGADRGLTDAFAATLARFPRLRTLELNNQDRLAGDALAAIARLSKLEKLSLRGCEGIPAGAFAPLGALAGLRELDLGGTAAGDADAAGISGIPRLSRLAIGSPNLTDAGLREIAKLFSVEYLTIDDSRATDAGLAALGRVNRLKNLAIRGDAIAGTGLGPICGLPELNDLRLMCPGLTDVAFEHLSRAKSLRKLRLAERGVKPAAALTDEGLVPIANATWLAELWLPRNDTGLTEAAILALKEKMPRTNVIPYTVEWKKPAP